MDPELIAGMSDDEFLKALNSGQLNEAEPEKEPEEPTPETTTQPADTEQTTQEPAKTSDENPDTVEPAGDPMGAASDTPTEQTATTNAESPEATGGEGESKPGTEPEPDYKAFYESLVGKAIKANGGELVLKSQEEVLKLVQQGVNYTQNSQALAADRKRLMMLQNAGLDDEKLSLAIDLLNGDAEAIKRVLKEKAIDPLDLDMNVEPAYQAGRHIVSDAQATFQYHLDQLNATEDGKQTLEVVASTWDRDSKAALGSNPDVLTAIHAQRASGIYDRIVGEVNRQRALGSIPPTTKFLDAYTAVGNWMQNQGAFNDLAPANTAATTKVTPPLERKPATVKPTVANSATAAAAGGVRTTPVTANTEPDFSKMSDKEIAEHAAKILAA